MSFNNIINNYFLSNHKFLTNVAAKRLSNNHHVAEEAVQESYVKALKYQDSFDESVASFDKWFRKIFNNVVKDVSKKERMQGATEDAKDCSVEYIPNIRDILPDKINEYTDNQRDKEILYLRYIKGMPLKDIHYFVDTSYGNCRKVCSLFNIYLSEA